MRVEVSPLQAQIQPGIPLPVSVTITNTSDVIGGYQLRVLGADPDWVQAPAEQNSLFPQESRTLVLTITPPAGLPAGSRRLAVQVRELTPPYESIITELDLTVPAARSVRLRVDPLTVTAGRRGSFGIIVENTGNTVVTGHVAGDDAEGKSTFRFTPDGVSLAPGERALVDMTVAARRRLAGSPVVRTYGLYLDDATDFFDERPAGPPRRIEHEALGHATFIQRAVLSRGGISLLGLLAAVTVFAIVITLALSRLVGQSAADRDLALQVAAARDSGSGTGSASVSGTVRLITTGQPITEAVSVDVYAASDPSVAVVTTATDKDGRYRVVNLPAGAYKISYRGAGFAQLWYPGAATDSDASAVTLTAGQSRTGLDVLVGGLPATVTGTVTGVDVSASTLFLMKPADGGTGTSPAAVSDDPTAPTAPVGPVAPPDTGGAVVQSVPVGSDGSFTLTNVPSPSVYDLVVSKPGFATATQRLDIGAGEKRSGVSITLAKGDGLISGTVGSPTGPLDGVTLTATTGQSVATTVSLTGTGAFTLRALPTPATFTVVASRTGFAAQTQTVTLAAGQHLTGLTITLTASSGSLSGRVSLVPSGDPAPGVAVTVTNGDLTVQAQTQSTDDNGGKVGQWSVAGLPLPGTYTVTFTRPDLQSQTVAVALDAAGTVTPGSQGATVGTDGLITVGMRSATAVLYGTVSQHDSADPDSAVSAVGEVTVRLTSGSATYTVTTASVPKSRVGQYRIEAIPPGTWTVSVSRSGTSPTSTILTLAAGDEKQYSPELAAPAAIHVTVSGESCQGRLVQVYQAADYPDVVSYSGTTDADCRVDLPAVEAPAAYVIVTRATAGSAEDDSKTVQVEASQQKSVTLKVQS